MSEKETELLPCPFCKKEPFFSGRPWTVVHKGTDLSLYVIECDNEDGESIVPFMEHNVCVYGATKEEAINRWNEAMKPKSQDG